MRWVLYQEGVAMFANNPVFGVGSTLFGECSCTGPGGYPHSTILQGFAELGLIGGGALAALLGLAAATLVRPFLSALLEADGSVRAFILALFSVFLVADQIYGNYFMSVGTWLILGMAASMRAHD
jgi:O-antigen ligase